MNLSLPLDLRQRRISIVICALVLTSVVLACGVGEGVVTNTTPSWACPSPTPRPWGPSGPMKGSEDIIDPTTGVITTTNIYYQEWEQEYPTPGLSVYPSPTPYAIVGTDYTFGQRVAIGATHVILTARAGAAVTEAQFPPDMQLYYLDLTWRNSSPQPVAVDYRTQVRLRAVIRPDGRALTDRGWPTTADAQRLSGITPPTSIPPGESRATIPVIAPAGTPSVAELVYRSDVSYVPPAAATPTTGATTPTPTPPGVTTPTPNTDLRRSGPNLLTIQFSQATTTVGPPCSDAGATTGWTSADGQAWGRPAPISGVAAPPGADRLVQIALNQVGKPYVWGSQGPESFDCSGLMRWAYGQIGISIPQGTGRSGKRGQWYDMQPVDAANVKPGDLIFFDLGGAGYVDHVGMLVGDLNGDGAWDMVHAANPKLGVRIDHGVMQSRYYRPRILGYRTAR